MFVPRGKRSLVRAQFDEVVTMLEGSRPAVARMLDEWDSADRLYFIENTMRFLDLIPEEMAHQELTAA